MFEQIKELYLKINAKHIKLSQEIIKLAAKKEELVLKQKEEFGTTRKVPLKIRLFFPRKKEEFLRRQEAMRKIDLELEELISKRDEEFHKNNKSPLFMGVATTEEILNLKVDRIIKNIKNHESNGVSTQYLIEELSKENGHVMLSEKDKLKKTTTTGKYALVHLTDHIPKNGQISTKNALKTIEGSFGSFPIPEPKESHHFWVNSCIQNANLSSLLEKKYAIIIPLTQIPKDKNIITANRENFIIQDKVKLTNQCYIICNEKDYEQIKKENPIAKVITIEQEEVYSFIPTILNLLGYAYIPDRGNKSKDQGYEKLYRSFIEKRFGKVSYLPYSFTIEKQEENLREGLGILKGIEQGILEGKCIVNENTMRELKKYYKRAIEEILASLKDEKNEMREKWLTEIKEYLRLNDLKDEETCIRAYEKQLKYLSKKIEVVALNNTKKPKR